MAPIGATPFAGLVPWLASLWRRLRTSVEKRVATDEEKQVLHLIEFAASRFGDPLLRASSIDDLDDRLDTLVSSPDALYCTALLAQHVSLFQKSEAISAAHLAESVGENLGAAQGRVISESQQVLDAWLDAQRQVAGLIASHAPTDADRIFEFSLASPEVPAEFAQLVFHSLRAGYCSLAIARALAVEMPIDPWLAHALTERLVTSARELFCLGWNVTDRPPRYVPYVSGVQEPDVRIQASHGRKARSRSSPSGRPPEPMVHVGMAEAFAIEPELVRPITRSEYDRMVALGLFADERVELLRGTLVKMSPQLAPHASTIRKLTRLLMEQLQGRFELSIQSPLALSDDSEPEPDVAVVPLGNYDTEHPMTALLVIEVSDTTLRKDRRKAVLYASAGIGEYWIVNLGARAIEVYSSPDGDRYAEAHTLRAGDVLRPAALAGVEVAVAEILPQA